MRRRLLAHPLYAVASLLCVGLLTTACAPTCQQVCHKLERCGFNASVSVSACVNACEFGSSDARERKDKALYEAQAQQRRCVGASSCDALADDACYDDTLYPYGVTIDEPT